MREPTAPAYYDRRAPEYDDWYLGVGLYAERDRPGFDEELERILTTVAALPPVRTLDVACGTGFVTRHLRGSVTGLDASARMLAIAAERMPGATFLQGDALSLSPSPTTASTASSPATSTGTSTPASARRCSSAAGRRRARRGRRLQRALRNRRGVVAPRPGRRLALGGVQALVRLETLLAELGGGEVLHAGRWFLVVRSSR